MTTTIRAVGNAGFVVESGGARAAVDAFHEGSTAAALKPEQSPDLILVTHSHWDHFDALLLAEAAKRFGSVVGCPASVGRRLRGKIASEAIVEFEPEEGGSCSVSVSTSKGHSIRVTAFRTQHSYDHNSYLVETPGLRFFHDGDNENTRLLDMGVLRGVDILFLAPWQGSGWPEFVERVGPRYWFLIHLTDEELDEHEKGAFLSSLCPKVPVPDRIVALRPGMTFAIGEAP